MFNDALNPYLRLYSVGHMVKDHSDSERGNPLPPLHGLFFPIRSEGFLYAPAHRQDSTYHGLCYTSRGALRESTMKDWSEDLMYPELTYEKILVQMKQNQVWAKCISLTTHSTHCINSCEGVGIYIHTYTHTHTHIYIYIYIYIYMCVCVCDCVYGCMLNLNSQPNHPTNLPNTSSSLTEIDLDSIAHQASAQSMDYRCILQ